MEEKGNLPMDTVDRPQTSLSVQSSIPDVNFRPIPPVDFSFKHLSSVDDLAKHKPRKIRVGKMPTMGRNNKYVATSLWLSNNLMQTTKDVATIVNKLVEQPEKLAWLDISFNQIYDIDEALLQYPNLKILYLHGNQIQNVAALSLLQPLSQLQTLTLHGNPVDSIPQYRSYVINTLPQLTNLDFSPIVTSERKAVPPPGFTEQLKADKKKPVKSKQL